MVFMQVITKAQATSDLVCLEFFSSSLSGDEVHIFAKIDQSLLLVKKMACRADRFAANWLFACCHDFHIPLQLGSQRVFLRARDCADILHLSEEEFLSTYQLHNIHQLFIERMHIDTSNVFRTVNLATSNIKEASFLNRRLKEVALTISHLDFELIFSEIDSPIAVLRKISYENLNIGYLEKIEEGCCSIVYKTTILGRKTFASKISFNSLGVSELKREIEDLRGLHRIQKALAIQDAPLGIIRYEGGFIGFLGTYYEKGDLFKNILEGMFLAREGLSLLQLFTMILPIITTLVELQKRKIVLLDVRLENIFCDARNRAVLGDLGHFAILAKNLTEVDFRFSLSRKILVKDQKQLTDLEISLGSTIVKTENQLFFLHTYNELLKKIQVFEMGLVLFFLCEGLDSSRFPFFDDEEFGLIKKEEFVFSPNIPTQIQSIISRMLDEDSEYTLHEALEDLQLFKQRA